MIVVSTRRCFECSSCELRGSSRSALRSEGSERTLKRFALRQVVVVGLCQERVLVAPNDTLEEAGVGLT
jgi:hypothetical protein